jgi:hypothetical protein
MDSLFTDKLFQAGLTNGTPPNKLCEIQGNAEYLVVEVDIEKKRPSLPRTVHSRPNVTLISMGGPPLAEKQEFLKEIAHDDERYRSIDQLFVAPVVERGVTSSLFMILGREGSGNRGTPYSIRARKK